MEPLPRSFFQRPVLRVAPDLLGCTLIRRVRGTTVTGRIVEVEAYRGDDPASHSYRGRTHRNAVMFGPGGHLYVYFTYGMHFCMNVVTGAEGEGEAVLLRAVEPLIGLETMALRRYGRKALGSRTEVRNLCRGPARLCEAFSIGRSQNGIPLDSQHLFLARPQPGERISIGRSQRVGIRNGRDRKWRFFVRGSEWISDLRVVR